MGGNTKIVGQIWRNSKFLILQVYCSLVATQHVFDAITGQAIFGAMLAGTTSDSIMSTTNEYGNLVTNKKCEGIMDTLTIGKIGYCDNSVTVNAMGACVVQNVPLMPSAGSIFLKCKIWFSRYKFFIYQKK